MVSTGDEFSCRVCGLEPSTTYVFSPFLRNSALIREGDTLYFTTLAGEEPPGPDPDPGSVQPDPDPGSTQPDSTAILLAPLAYWKLDESSGNSAHDSSGNYHDGTLYGNPTWMPTGGMIDGALAFDGLGDYVRIADHPDFDLTTEITIAAWIKVDVFDKAWQAIVTKGDSAWRIQRSASSNGIEFACSGLSVPGTTWGNVLGTVNVNDGQWHHLAGLYDGATVYLYVDGILDASAPAYGVIATNSFDVCIGENVDQPGRYWNGLIDDVRIYDVALSEEQTAAVMTTGGSTLEPPDAEPFSGMIGYWPGDGNADDLAGGHDGTLRNGATFAPGLVGQAFSLDGTNDYVRIPHALGLTPASVTVEAWIKPDRVNKWMRIFCSQLSYQLNLSNRGEIASLIRPTLRGGESYLSLRGGNVPVGEWSHVACTYDAPSGQWRLYVDGVQVRSDDLEDNNPLLPNTEDLRIGAIYSDAHYFDGLIDEVVLYDRALSPQEIQDLYQALNE
jgi:hypothetical protein